MLSAPPSVFVGLSFSLSVTLFWKKAAACGLLPPTTQNKRYIHLCATACETPSRNFWVLFPTARATEYNVIHATGRKQAKWCLVSSPYNVENMQYFLRMECTVFDRSLRAVTTETNVYMRREYNGRFWGHWEPGVSRGVPPKYQMCLENHGP